MSIKIERSEEEKTLRFITQRQRTTKLVEHVYKVNMIRT